MRSKPMLCIAAVCFLLSMLLLVPLLGGCTANIRMTDINLEAGHDMAVDNSGAQNTTDTGQLATADMAALIGAVTKAFAGKKASIIDKIKDALGGDDEDDEGAAVEEQTAEPDALEDFPGLETGTGIVEEVQ